MEANRTKDIFFSEGFMELPGTINKNTLCLVIYLFVSLCFGANVFGFMNILRFVIFKLFLIIVRLL